MDSGYPFAYALSSAAGIRPFLTLALTAWMLHSGALHPAVAFSWLGQDGVAILMTLLACVEFLADKIPFIDHLFHIVHFATKPIAAGLVAGGTINFSDQHSKDLAMDACVIAASAMNATGMHLFAVAVRGVTSSFTFGAVNPIVSIFEDVLCVLALVLALTMPAIGVILAILCTVSSAYVARLALRKLRSVRSRFGRSFQRPKLDATRL